MRGTDLEVGRWIWLFPATYLVHIAEEYAAGEGFPAWLSRTAGIALSPERFLVLNAVLWLAMCACAAAALRHRRLAWMAAGLAALVTINGTLHVLGTVWTRAYSPGLVSGACLWLPLGAAVLRKGWRQLPGRTFGWAVAAGAAGHAAVSLLALGAGGWGR